MTSNIMDKVFSKMNDRGIKIAYWVSSVLTISFLVSFIINTIYTTAFRGFGIINSILIGSNDKHELEWLILLYILSVLAELIPLLILNAIRKWTKIRLNEDIDKKSIYFATGIYIIFTNIFGLVATVNSIVGLLFNGRWGWGVHIDSNSIVYVFISFMTTILYILIGIQFIKKSDFIPEDKKVAMTS